MKYSCIIAEDESPIRKNLCNRITSDIPHFEVIADCKNGQEVLDFVETNKLIPDLLMTDVEMPIMDGLDLTQEFYYHYPNTKVIIVSAYDNFSYAQRAIRYNVHDYLIKPLSNEVLKEALDGIFIQLESLKEPQTHTPSSLLPSGNSPQGIAKSIQEYIRLHYKEEISLSDLTSLFGFSDAYLRNTFKKYNGVTPSQYQTQLRMNEAKKILLTSSDINVSTVGKLVGYDDPYYFSRIFQKCTGLYPSEYRRK